MSEQVGALIQFLAQRLLGRHIFHGADQSAALGHAVAAKRARQAEIHDQDAAGLVAHDVLRLQIAVDDAYAVRGFQRAADLLHDVDGFFGIELFLLMNDGTKVLTLDVLHGDELHAFGFAQVVNTDDVFVRDLMGENQFLLEAVDNRLIAGELGRMTFKATMRFSSRSRAL